jgi:BirA family transcriptional regulator, biotin operon repressor / biotin---[acetyl-CoA-carboxylase] ligase
VEQLFLNGSGVTRSMGTDTLDRRDALLRLLADGQLHSGAELAAALGVSRAAVWKTLHRAAEELGLELKAVRRKGYMLARPLELLDRAAIEAALPAPVRAGLDIEVRFSVDSTNTRLMQAAGAGAPSGRVCLAERQLAGRGRAGRGWVSPFGENIYLSMLWRYPGGPAGLGGLSLACGVAVAELLRGAGVADIALKWPNDLHWRRRKLGGLLLEVAGESHGPSHVVVGLGLNRRLGSQQAAAIDQPWVDLGGVLGDALPGRNALAAALIEALAAALAAYGEHGLAPFLPAWRGFDAYQGEPVVLLMGGQQLAGTCAGIADDGALLLDTPEGLRAFHAGEVSLRPSSPVPGD